MTTGTSTDAVRPKGLAIAWLYSIEYSQKTPYSSRVRRSYELSSGSIFFPLHVIYVKMPILVPTIAKMNITLILYNPVGFPFAIFVTGMTPPVFIGAMIVLYFPSYEPFFAYNVHLSMDMYSYTQ